MYTKIENKQEYGKKLKIGKRKLFNTKLTFKTYGKKLPVHKPNWQLYLR